MAQVTKRRKLVMDNPAQLGERLLPQVVDQYALHCPDRIFGSYPNSNGTSLVYHEVTMGQLASAVNFLAWWIKRKIGTSFDFETVSFIGISDFRYSMFCLAGIKCGFKVLLPGTRNSVAQIKSLLHRTACKKMIYSPEMAAAVEKLELEIAVEIPSLEIILTSRSPNYNYTTSLGSN